MTGMAGLLVYSLFDLQYNQYEHYAKLASQQHWQQVVVQPQRGDILDTNGSILAGTTYVYTIGVTPKDVKSLQYSKMSKTEIGTKIASILSIDPAEVLETLEKEDLKYVQLVKNIDKDTADVLRDYLAKNEIGGVRLDDVAKRYYLHDDLASQVLGYANAVDGLLIGQLGIEAQYNKVLTGTAGYVYSEVASISQNTLPYSSPTTVDAKDGYNLTLHIDRSIQAIAEKEIREIYDVFDVQGGVTAIVMDPYTGGILADANYPSFNPNNPAAQPDYLSADEWEAMSETERLELIMSTAWRNRSISDANEPGSTFKTLTTAMALEEAVASENSGFVDEPYVYGPGPKDHIACWLQNNGEGNHGGESLVEAFANSCNPIFVQLSQRVGREKFYKYVENFGFTAPTGIDLPAEGTGMIYPDGQPEPSVIDMSTLAIGESATVTPIQLITAYAAVANGGNLMVPQVAKSLTDSAGNTVKKFEPKVNRSIFSERTAARVRDLMKGVVQEGTGAAASIPGYAVAGKTGTSTFEQGENKGLHVLSFGGYAPSDDPEIVVLVVIDRPLEPDVGSSVASAAAARIIEQTLSYLQVEREYKDGDREKMTMEFEIPDEIVGMPYKEAKALLFDKSFRVLDNETIPDKDAVVTAMYPESGSFLYKNGKIVLCTSEDMTIRETVVPIFIGKNISEILDEAYKSDLNVLIEGNAGGVAVSQSIAVGPPPGKEEDDGENGEDDPGRTRESDSETEPEDARETEGENGSGPARETQEEPEADQEAKKVRIGTIIRIVME